MGVVLQVIEVDGGQRVQPILRCDVCNEIIENHHKGNIVWSSTTPVVAGDAVPYLLVHKGACDRQHQATIPG